MACNDIKRRVVSGSGIFEYIYIYIYTLHSRQVAFFRKPLRASCPRNERFREVPNILLGLSLACGEHLSTKHKIQQRTTGPQPITSSPERDFPFVIDVCDCVH